MNGTLFKTSQWNATNTSYMTFGNWNSTNISYALFNDLNNGSYLNLDWLLKSQWNATNTSYLTSETLWNANYSTFLLNNISMNNSVKNVISALNNGSFFNYPWNSTNTSYMTFGNWNSTNISYALFNDLNNGSYLNLDWLLKSQWNATNTSYLTSETLWNANYSTFLTHRAMSNNTFYGNLDAQDNITIAGSGTSIAGLTIANGWLRLGSTLGIDDNELYFGANSYMGTIGAFDLYIRTNSATRMFFADNGKIGIPTTSPNETLTIIGNASVSDSLFSMGFNLTNIYNTINNGSYFNTAGGSGTTTGTGTLNYIPMWNDTNSLNNSNIYNNGTKIGIGITAPSGFLHIIGGNSNTLMLDNNGEQYTSLHFRNNNTLSDGTSNKASIWWDNTTGVLSILAPLKSISLQPYNGKVGIGTVNPNEKLSVVGNASVSDSLFSMGFNLTNIYNTINNGSYFNTAGGGISWETATNGTLRLTNNNTFYPNMMIGTSNQFGLLHVDGGIDNSTINGKTTELGGYIANALISIGIYQNHLLQTEVYGTTWVVSGITIINNGDYSPAYTLTAEHLNTTTTAGFLHQGVTNITNGTWTYSQWMRCRSGTACIVGMEINSTGQVGQVKNHTVGSNWERYYVTQTLNLTHARLHVITRTYGSNISLWGSQLEIGNEPRPYSGARTTTNLSAFTSTTLFRTAIATTGSGSFVGVAVGGALSGASTGAFTGAVSMAGLTATTGIFRGMVTHSIVNTQWGNITGILLTNPTPANSTHKRFWIQNPPSIYFNGTATNGTGHFQKTSAYQISMNITNGTIPTNYLAFNTISGNGASLIVNERLRLNDSGLTINSTNVGLTGKYMIGAICSATYTGGIVTATNCTTTL
jgi:hypothetical protein